MGVSVFLPIVMLMAGDVVLLVMLLGVMAVMPIMPVPLLLMLFGVG